MSGRCRVVVIGAGFGGLAACEALVGADLDIVLVDRHNYNTFQPLLYQVATAGLNPGDIAYPVRAYMGQHPHLRFRQDEVTNVDFSARTVLFKEGPELGYDFLVLAAGAGTTFFGVSGAAEHAKAIYTMEDAIAVREMALASVERASAHGAGEGDLTVVVVGGGPTGVEMAGALADLRQMELRTQYRELDPSASRLVLVEQQDRLLGAFHPKLSAYARRVLERRGVEVRCRESVKEVRSDQVVLGSGEVVACKLVIWAAGVGPCGLTEAISLPKARGRVEVGDDLRGEWVPRRIRHRRHGGRPPRRRGASPAPAGPAGDTGGQARRRADPAPARRGGDSSVSLQGQGDHGDDRAEGGGGAAAGRPPPTGDARLARLARPAHRPSHRRAQPDICALELGVAVLVVA